MRLMSIVRFTSLAVFLSCAASMHAQFGSGGGAPGQNGGSSPSVSLGNIGSTPHEPTVHNRHLQGSVRDADGKSVQGAVVYLKNLKSKETASMVADEQGTFRFGALDKTADYQVWAQADKKTGPLKTISQYDTRDEVSVNLKVE